MAQSAESSPGWAIELIPADDDGFQFYLDHYKPFRLDGLQQDPNAFSSTYAREVAFNNDVWRGRLYSDIAKTFVAVRLHDRRILSSCALIRLVRPNSGPDQSPPASSTGPNPPSSVTQEVAQGERVEFEVAAVYTRAECRGQGLAKSVIAATVEYARGEAQRQGKECDISVEVYAANTAGIALYERCGFVANPPTPEEPGVPGQSGLEPSRTELRMPDVRMHFRHPAPEQH